MAGFGNAQIARDADVQTHRAQRRDVDRLDRRHWWLALLVTMWLLLNFATLSLVAVTFRLAEARQYESGISFFLPGGGFNLAEPLFPVGLAVTAVFGSLTFTMAAAAGLIAIWHRRSLPSVWIIAGVSPWLVLVAESALIALGAVQQLR